MPKQIWTPQIVEQVSTKILPKHEELQAALKEISQLVKKNVSQDAVVKAFRKFDANPNAHLKNDGIILSNLLKKKEKAYVARLEHKLGDWGALQQSIFDKFKEAFEKVGPIQVSALKKAPGKLPPQLKIRENGALLSDTHFGLKIDKEEIETNEYSWEIAARRLGKFTEQIANYKKEHRDECPQLRLCLGGDLGQGIIHYDSDAGTDLITYQVIGISNYIIQMIDYLRHQYKTIVVECTPDNHLRLTHKGPNRATAQKFDNYSSMIHFTIQTAFRDAKDVIFHVPKSPITTFNVLGHKFGLTHGDTHISSGNVGTNININNITNQLLKLNASGVDNKQYAALLLGHVHTPAYLPVLPGTRTCLAINGTMSGTDGYASSKGFFTTTPTQILWETSSQFAIGDFRAVQLEDADTETRYEKIISPYRYGLELSKLSGIKFPTR